LEAVFDAFKQVDGSATRHYEGTGLGLALVKRMVGLMGGRVSVLSHLNQGSSFTIEFPAVYSLQTEALPETVLTSTSTKGLF
jgi:signal transduction histidine kinase